MVAAIPDHGRRIVASVDRAARALGIVPGMTITKARSFAPGLEVVDAEPEADLEGLRRLALWAGQRYSPFVAPDPPDGIWLDITGCAHLFDSERARLKDLHRRVAAFGLSVQIAVADTAGCAHAVARHVPAGRPVTIEPGEHRKAMAPLPIASLRLAPDVVEGLRKLGFERVEQLIGEPRAPLAKRFGRTLHRRLDQALGFVPEPLEPIFPDQLPRCRRGFVEPIATADVFNKVIGDLASDIVGQLARLGKGARRLDCYFHRVDGHAQPWALFRFMGYPGESPEAKFVEDFLKARLERMEAVLAGREWLVAGRFTVADLLMADVLRQVDRFNGLANYPACHAYVARATVRPAFVKAYDDQMAHFAAADAA